MFDSKSRYFSEKPYIIADRRGRQVPVITVPNAPLQNLAGYHLLRQGQRADQLAFQYTGNATAFWRITEINDAMLPEALTEKPEIAIPVK